MIDPYLSKKVAAVMSTKEFQDFVRFRFGPSNAKAEAFIKEVQLIAHEPTDPDFFNELVEMLGLP